MRSKYSTGFSVIASVRENPDSLYVLLRGVLQWLLHSVSHYSTQPSFEAAQRLAGHSTTKHDDGTICGGGGGGCVCIVAACLCLSTTCVRSVSVRPSCLDVCSQIVAVLRASAYEVRKGLVLLTPSPPCSNLSAFGRPVGGCPLLTDPHTF